MTHQELVSKLMKPGTHILASLNPQRCELIHMSHKLCCEAGELGDAIGKNSYYEQPLDINNVIEELGDMEFYMEGIRKVLGLSREETLAHNISKLSIRYANLEYSNQSAQERADKK